MEILKIAKKPNLDCMVCGEELVYTSGYEAAKCYYCEKEFITNVKCAKGHYVCEICHQKDVCDLIEEYCVNSKMLNPIELVNEIMRNKSIAMHGPEHHFLVPAVLLACYYNNKEQRQRNKKEKIAIAKKRAREIPSNSCGYLGACGAAIGSGIFMSIITESTPYSEERWTKANELTGKTLVELSKVTGPRCCKRAVFTAIDESERFLQKSLNLTIMGTNDVIICEHSKNNNQCIGKKCTYNRANYLSIEV